MSANSENGGNASAPTAPETKAMARRRQPQDRMTPSTSEARTLARGMTVESARLKETSLVDRRIAIASCAPSISQTAIVNGRAMRANSENGGNASAPTAPETKAMARRRQPQDGVTPSTSEARTLARGMTLESARLKETSLVDRRIAFADHSPNGGRVRTSTNRSI